MASWNIRRKKNVLPILHNYPQLNPHNQKWASDRQSLSFQCYYRYITTTDKEEEQGRGKNDLIRITNSIFLHHVIWFVVGFFLTPSNFKHKAYAWNMLGERTTNITQHKIYRSTCCSFLCAMTSRQQYIHNIHFPWCSQKLTHFLCCGFSAPHFFSFVAVW